MKQMYTYFTVVDKPFVTNNSLDESQLAMLLSIVRQRVLVLCPFVDLW